MTMQSTMCSTTSFKLGKIYSINSALIVCFYRNTFLLTNDVQ